MLRWRCRNESSPRQPRNHFVDEHHEVGASQWRIRLFILAYADSSLALRQSRGNQTIVGRRGVRGEHRSDRTAGRAIRERQELDLDVDALPGTRSEARKPEDDLPIFPPGPFDLAAWEPILARHPHVQPCVLRVDDGMAFTLDRHHAVGNGVVPLAAAYAYRTLKAAFTGA